MLASSDSETEILLGNKQLVGIFLVVAVLLGVAFTAGYMVGRGGAAKKPLAQTADAPVPENTPKAGPTAPGGQTHTLGAEESLSKQAQDEEPGPSSKTATPLGARKSREAASTQTPVAKAPVTSPSDGERSSNEAYTPHPGSKYLQVAAVSRDEAEAVADVLHKKGFHAHAVPKPGNPKVFRVIIGPLRDAGDLSSTRDALRKTGFREVIVQSY